MEPESGGLFKTIAWTSDYRIGIETLDRDHEQLFAHFNDLLRRLADSPSPDATRASIDELEKLFGEHFETEEALMRSVNFPGLDAHKAKHQTFLEMLRGLKGFNPGGHAFTDYFLRVLRNWIIYHIAVNDRELGQFIAHTGKRSQG